MAATALESLLAGGGSDATLGDLPAFDFTVTSDTRTDVVSSELDRRPEAPGVIVVEAGRLLGVISRERLLKQFTRPFAMDLFLTRPIRLVLDAIAPDTAVLRSDTGIAEAARIVLKRPTELVFEPIVVEFPEPRRPRHTLLDVHTLLLAQSQLLAMANETIQQQKERADAANEAKSQFLANMSHEIRTPLTAILGFAENLLDARLPERERIDAVRTIVRNGQHPMEVINDILDLSKIEAGKLETERIACSPAQIAADVISVMRVRADAKGLPLVLELRPPLPETVETDPTRLQQILMNLVGNAIKFTESGRVVLSVSLDADDPSRPRLRCDVRDTGIGLTSDQIARLFAPFTQADQTMARRFGGTGLGLAISQRFARLLGGDIRVASQPGRGSVFTVTVDAGPLQGVRLLDDPGEALSTEPAPAVLDLESLSLDCRILLAEDSPDNQMLIASFLRRCGAEVAIADNGRAAVEQALAALGAGRPFDVLLMDMQMPVLDGYEATRQLRERGYRRSIIALTANAMHEERERCRRAGCDGFATKPIDRRRLIEQIMDACGDPTGGSPAGERKAAGHGNGSPHAASTRYVALDRDLALARAGDDEAILRELAALLAEYCPRWLTEIEAALAAGDAPTLRRLAHTLKSSADNIGAIGARDAAWRLECLAESGELEAGREAFPQLAAALDGLLPEVGRLIEDLAPVS